MDNCVACVAHVAHATQFENDVKEKEIKFSSVAFAVAAAFAIVEPQH